MQNLVLSVAVKCCCRRLDFMTTGSIGAVYTLARTGGKHELVPFAISVSQFCGKIRSSKIGRLGVIHHLMLAEFIIFGVVKDRSSRGGEIRHLVAMARG